MRSRILISPRRIALATFAGLLLAGSLAASARGEPEWTTYHRDQGRSGYDSEAATPIVPTFAWQSIDLGAPIWGQPLVLGSRVYVATVGDELYALDASSGAIVWQKSLGVPVPASALPCGDIEPTVGVVGTPVIDAATGVIYAVADTWEAATKKARHVLDGIRITDGEQALSVPVDPPSADPKALLQRTALNLDGERVIFGFGGNDGDCSDYRGTVVSAPLSSTGGPPLFWQVPIAAPSSFGGAVWGASGPAVAPGGDIYASTGNPNPPPGKTATTYDYSDSLLALDPVHDFVADPAHESVAPLGFFEPPSWEADSNSDLDLGSAGPELLPGGLIFQAGKNGLGYLIDETTMSSGAEAVYSAEVCGGHGSFGGDAFAQGTIYLACTDGVQALAYDQAARTFAPLWQGPSDAFGPPIVAAGLVWSLATGGFEGGGETLYGLDPASGVPRYTITLPSPIADHFSSPSAAGGRLFVATGSTVSAYQIAIPASTPSPCEANANAPGCSPAPPGQSPGGTGATGGAGGAVSTPTPHAAPATRRCPLRHAHSRKRASSKKRASRGAPATGNRKARRPAAGDRRCGPHAPRSRARSRPHRRHHPSASRPRGRRSVCCAA